MKRYICNLATLFVAGVLTFAGCDNYDRTEVDYAIFVNRQSVTLFVGEQTQLVASPDDGGTFSWYTDDPEVATVENGLITAVGAGSTDIIAERDGLSFRVEVTVQEKVVLTDIKLDTYDLSITIGSTKEMTVEMVPIDANDVPLSDFDWWSDDESVARVNHAGEITGIGEGSTTIHYRKGSIVKDVSVYVSTTLPFNGPHILSAAAPLELWFRDFDMGGKNVAYYDNTSGNSGGSTYRSDGGDTNSPDVDIEGAGNLGYTASGEWLLYTLEIQDAGTYSIQISGAGNGGTFYLELDGEKITNDINIKSTSGWGDYQMNEPFEVDFPEGKHKLKFYMSNAAYNINYWTFTFVK